jgi:hypothetical protein
VFKKGDLFFLNTKGLLLFKHIGGENGIIMSNAYLIYENDHAPETRVAQYYAYDVLIKGILFREMPEKFLKRVIKNEKDII